MPSPAICEAYLEETLSLTRRIEPTKMKVLKASMPKACYQVSVCTLRVGKLSCLTPPLLLASVCDNMVKKMYMEAIAPNICAPTMMIICSTQE